MKNCVIFHKVPNVKVNEYICKEFVYINFISNEKQLICNYLDEHNLSKTFCHIYALIPIEITDLLKQYLSDKVEYGFLITKRKYNPELHDIINNMISSW